METEAAAGARSGAVTSRPSGGKRAGSSRVDSSTGGAGLTQALSADRVCHELDQQIRRAFPCEAVAVALLAGAADAGPRLVYQLGFDDADPALHASLAAIWREVVADGEARTRVVPDGIDITVPIGSRGAVTARLPDQEPGSSLQEAIVTLVGIAGHADLAFERAAAIGRLIDRERRRAMESVTGSIAHELRNPVFGISAAAQLLRYSVGEDPGVEKTVGRILRETEHLNGMITALLDYARPAPIRVSAADPDQVWTDVLQAERGALEARAVIVAHRPATPRAVCTIDGEQLAQAFRHCLRNAVDAAPEGSDISLESSVSTGDSWTCRLRDSGRGLDTDTMARAFDPFFSTKPGHPGVGLAIARRIILDHRGSISIDSAAGSGATLSIALPV